MFWKCIRVYVSSNKMVMANLLSGTNELTEKAGQWWSSWWHGTRGGLTQVENEEDQMVGGLATTQTKKAATNSFTSFAKPAKIWAFPRGIQCKRRENRTCSGRQTTGPDYFPTVSTGPAAPAQHVPPGSERRLGCRLNTATQSSLTSHGECLWWGPRKLLGCWLVPKALLSTPCGR